MADQTNNSLLDIANNGAALNQALSELTTNVAKLSSIILPAANGGTGLTSPGSSGNVLTSNGTTWQSSALPVSGVTSIGFGTTGLTPNTASSGSISVAGTLNVSNGGTGLSSLTAYGVLCGGTTTTGAAQSLATGTLGQVLTSNGASALPSWQNKIVSETAKDYNWNGLTTNKSLEFTSLPSWIKRITVILNGVSTNGLSLVQIQVGSGSYTTSGYTGTFANGYAANTVQVGNNGTGFIYGDAASTDLRTGNAVLTNISGNIWVCSSLIGGNGGFATTCGTITLSSTLDRIRITTVSGADNFDAGSVNIFYE